MCCDSVIAVTPMYEILETRRVFLLADALSVLCVYVLSQFCQIHPPNDTDLCESADKHMP